MAVDASEKVSRWAYMRIRMVDGIFRPLDQRPHKDFLRQRDNDKLCESAAEQRQMELYGNVQFYRRTKWYCRAPAPGAAPTTYSADAVKFVSVP